jgi:hypothetical protein
MGRRVKGPKDGYIYIYIYIYIYYMNDRAFQLKYIISVYYDNLYTKCVLYRYEKMFDNQFVIMAIHKFCYL